MFEFASVGNLLDAQAADLLDAVHLLFGLEQDVGFLADGGLDFGILVSVGTFLAGAGGSADGERAALVLVGHLHVAVDLVEDQTIGGDNKFEFVKGRQRKRSLLPTGRRNRYRTQDPFAQ